VRDDDYCAGCGARAAQRKTLLATRKLADEWRNELELQKLYPNTNCRFFWTGDLTYPPPPVGVPWLEQRIYDLQGVVKRLTAERDEALKGPTYQQNAYWKARAEEAEEALKSVKALADEPLARVRSGDFRT
jgi:hypothetical protein